MKDKIKEFMIGTIFRLIWSVLFSILFSIIAYVSFKFLFASSVTILPFTVALPRLIPIFFALSFSFLYSMFLVSLASRMSEPKTFQKIGERIEQISLQTRRSLSEAFKWTTICCFLILPTLLVQIAQESRTSTIYQSYLFPWWIFVYTISILFAILTRALMNHLDWTIFNLEEFRREKNPQNLQKALRDFNKVLDSTLSWKRLLAISQYVVEAIKIGNKNEVEEIDRQIDILVRSLRTRSICGADENLVSLASFTRNIVKGHREVLGFRIRYPHRTRLWETAKSSFVKIFPQVILVLVWIAVLIVLAYFGIIHVIFPP